MKNRTSSLVATLCTAGGGALWLVSKGLRRAPKPTSNGDLAMRRFTTYFVVPVWIGAGFLDYLWHRQTRIETTSGIKESLMHSLMMAEAGPAVLSGLLLETNAGTIALMLALATLHELTAIWDVTFTAPQRVIPPREQHTHTFLEMIPYCVASAAICTHWEQFLALLGQGPERARFTIELRKPPVPARDLLLMFLWIGLIGGLPHAEELWRCWQAKREGLTGRDTPACARELFS